MSAKCLFLLLALTPASAKPIPLAETLAPDDCFRVRLRMTLKGTMTFHKDGKKQALPLEASARHELTERVLLVGKDGSADKTARLYETAQATIKPGTQTTTRVLRPERRLLVAQFHNDELLVYSPAGPLHRDELDLCSEHFDTLHLVGLLPGGERAVGDTWKIGNTTVQALCHFEGMTEQKLVGKLDAVEADYALFSVKGTATGIDVGALVKTTVEAQGVFDLKTKRLIKLTWKQQDEREQGPTSPASTLTTETRIQRTPIARPDGLGVVALASVPEGRDVPPQMLFMEYSHPKNRYGLMYPRDWHLVAQTEEHVVMRLMERGDFVAQVTVSLLRSQPAGKHLSPAEFTETVERSEGWAPTQTVEARELSLLRGCYCYRLAQSGKLNGVEVVQHHYLVAHEDGRQVALVFCMTPKQADRLGGRDVHIVSGLAFPKLD